MAISETKMQIVIDNYFKDECDVNTSIRQAFEKGFHIGVKKGVSMNRPQGKWIDKGWHGDWQFETDKKARPKGEWIYQFRDSENEEYRCSVCGFPQGFKPNFCPNCGARMKGADDETD